MTTQKNAFLRRCTIPLTLCILLASHTIALPAGNVSLTCSVPIRGGFCQPGSNNVLAGMSIVISMGCIADLKRDSLRRGWPEGYTLEASLDQSDDQPFIPMQGLVDQLNPIPFLSFNNLANEWVMSHDESRLNLTDLNRKQIVLHVPSDLAGHSIAFHATYQKDGQVWISKRKKILQIIAPCHQSDSASILASKIYEAWVTLDDEKTVYLADSMLALGWSDPVGWKLAQSSAERLKLYDKRINYLDRMYQDFGITATRIGTQQAHRLSPDAVRDPEQQEIYERKRGGLLLAKARQDSQR